MTAAQDLLAGKPLEAALEPVLARMARIAGVDHAAFWVPRARASRRARPRSSASTASPCSRRPSALRHVLESAARGAKPSFAFAAENLDLGKALDRAEAPLRGAAGGALPHARAGCRASASSTTAPTPRARGPRRSSTSPRSRAPSPWRSSSSATLNTVRAAERALELALAGTASLGGLEHLVGSLETLRDRLGEIRSRTRRAALVRGAVRAARARRSPRPSPTPARSSPSAAARSASDTVYLEDLLAELRTPEVAVELEPAAETVPADAALLRVALRALADEVRSRAGANTAPLAIRVGAWTDGVRVSVRRAGRAADAGAGGAHRRPRAWASPAASPSCTAARSRTAAAGEIVLTLPAA